MRVEEGPCTPGLERDAVVTPDPHRPSPHQRSESGWATATLHHAAVLLEAGRPPVPATRRKRARAGGRGRGHGELPAPAPHCTSPRRWRLYTHPKAGPQAGVTCSVDQIFG